MATVEGQVNWAEQYVIELAQTMREMRGMETRLNERFDKVNDRIDNINRDLTERIENVNKDLTERIDNVNKDLTDRMDTTNKHTQNLVIAMIVGIGAMVIAVTVALVLAIKPALFG